MNHNTSLNRLAKRALSLVLLIIASSGCVEDVDDVNLPQVEPKLVVTSFITPNDTIKVKVSKSIPINYNIVSSGWDNYYQPIPEAVVTITNTLTKQSVEIPFDQKTGQFIMNPSEFAVENGQEFTLDVSAQGLTSVFSKTVVPTNYPELLSYKLDTINTQTWDLGDGSSHESHDILITGVIKDVKGEKNYYNVGIAMYEEYYDSWNDTTYEYTWYAGGYSFIDEGKDGEELTFRVNIYSSNNKKLIINIISSDEHYYRYHKSFYNWDSGNPFSEPSPIYSNIERGLGVFASYTITSVSIQ